MKRSVLIMLAMIPLAALVAQANTESLSRPHLVPHEAGKGLLVAASETLAPGSHERYGETERVSGEERPFSAIEKGSVTEGVNAKSVLNADENGEGEDENEDEEGEEDGKEDKEDEEGEDEGGWDRVWDAPKLG